MKGTVLSWLEKRLYNLRSDESFKDRNNKRWDVPIPALSKLYSLSILLASFVLFTYLADRFHFYQNDLLYFSILIISLAITFFMQRNFNDRLLFYRTKQED